MLTQWSPGWVCPKGYIWELGQSRHVHLPVDWVKNVQESCTKRSRDTVGTALYTGLLGTEDLGFM